MPTGASQRRTYLEAEERRARPRARGRPRARATAHHRPADRARLGTAFRRHSRGARTDARLRGIRAGDHGGLAHERPPRAARGTSTSSPGAGGARGRSTSKDQRATDRSHNIMSSTEALVFDAVRTPRGKGKHNGSVHSTKPVDLVVGLMHELLSRHVRLDPNRIADGGLGCGWPVGDQGPATAKTARTKAGVPRTAPG